MNNNNNKIIYKLLLLNSIWGENKKNNLHKLVNLKVEDNFFKNLEDTCEENNINIGICVNNFNKKIHGNFKNIQLEKLLKICFDDNFTIENNHNFIYIKEKELITKIYKISSYVNKNQLNSIEKFINEIVKNLGGEFILNKEDGYIFLKTLEKNHIIIGNYINEININLNKQVVLECKIISISKNKNNNKNLDLLSTGKTLLDKNIFSIFKGDINDYINFGSIFTKSLFFFKDLEGVFRFLSKIYTTESIFNIKILMYNKQVCEFKTEELRYSSNHYDTKIIDNHSNIQFSDNLIKKNIVKKNIDYRQPYVVKNLKSFSSGVNLEIIPHIREDDIILNINFNKSSFNENKRNEDLPNITTNSFVSSIKVNFDEIIILNGLKNNVTKKNIKNKTPFKFLNFFLSSEEIIESECEILFLIKVTKME
jgi:hypothetical protein